MKEGWPDVLTFHLRHHGADAVRRVVFIVMVDRPNNISVGPLMTDAAGLVRVARSELQQELRSRREACPMDYKAFRLAVPKILHFQVESTDSLKARAEAIREFFPAESTTYDELSRAPRLPIQQQTFSIEVDGKTNHFELDLAAEPNKLVGD